MRANNVCHEEGMCRCAKLHSPCLPESCRRIHIVITHYVIFRHNQSLARLEIFRCELRHACKSRGSRELCILVPSNHSGRALPYSMPCSMQKFPHSCTGMPTRCWLLHDQWRILGGRAVKTDCTSVPAVVLGLRTY